MVFVNRMPEEIRWQPMETAPKNGSKFWGKVGDDAIAMFWHDGFGEFISSYRQMRLRPGLTFDDTGLDTSDHSPVIHKPTHWMMAVRDTQQITQQEG